MSFAHVLSKTRWFIIFYAYVFCFLHDRFLFWGIIVPAEICKRRSLDINDWHKKDLSSEGQYVQCFFPQVSHPKNYHCLAVLSCLEPRCNSALSQLPTTEVTECWETEHLSGFFFKESFPAESTWMHIHCELTDLWLRTVASPDSSLKWINFHSFFIAQYGLNEELCETSNT